MNHRPRIYFRWNEILRNRRGRLWRPRKTHFVFPLRGPLARFVCWNFTRGSLTHLVFPDSVENIIYMCSLSGDWLANFPLSKSSPLLSISFYFSTRVSLRLIQPDFINLTQFQLTRFISNYTIFLSRVKEKMLFSRETLFYLREREYRLLYVEQVWWGSTGVEKPCTRGIILVERGKTELL